MISSCSQLRAKGRADLKGRWAEAAMFTFVFVLIAWFVSALGGGLDSVVFGPRVVNVNGDIDAVALIANSTPGILDFVAVLLILPVSWSWEVAFLGNHRAESDDPFSVGSLFTGYRDFLRVMGTMFMSSILTFLFTMLLIIPGIWMALRLALTPYILRDHPELKFNTALRLSADMMQGHKWKLLLLELSFLGWWVLVVLSLGIGYFWLAPYIGQTGVNFYEEVKAEYEARKQA